MIRAVAIDDEPLALKVIESFCSPSNEVNLLKTFTRPREGIKYIQQFPVDLVFLDIQMPSMLGTELAQLARPEVMIIFTTAYDNYAVEGFNLNAIDYLLKPISQTRFAQAIEKVKKYQTALKRNLVNSESYITVRADYSLFRIELSKIKYVEGLDDYIKIHMEDSKPIVTRFTMKAILELLPQKQFVRVHRSFIIAVNRVTSMKNKMLYLNELQIPIGNSFEQNLEGLFK